MARSCRTLCPECFSPLDGRYVARDGAVELERTCPDHGTTSPVVWRDADHFAWTDRFAAPDTDGDLTVVDRDACLVVLEVTTACNLTCDVCFASSGPDGDHLPLDAVEGRLDTVVEQGGPRPLQISGGEPTVHPELVTILERARERGFEHIEVNTNGIALAQGDLAKELADAGVASIYLQFDATSDEGQTPLRGQDLAATKREAIARCRDAGLDVVLAATVVEDINDDALGEIVRFAWSTEGVRAVNLQPMARFGRHAFDRDRLPLDAVASKLADQTSFLSPGDLVPVPCCSPRCQLATVLWPTDDGPVPVTRFLDDEAWAEIGPDVDEAAWMEVLSGSKKGRDPAFLSSCCGVEVPERFADVLDDALPIGIVGFMDAPAADLDVLGNCCIAVPTEDELVPFCAYQMTDDAGRYAFRRGEGWPGRREVS